MSTQLPWGKRSIGCCCDKDDICRFFYPCCVRQFRFEADFFVTQTTTDGPFEGDFSSAVVKSMTVENLCNDQESVDWSTFNDLTNVSGAAELTIAAGHDFQGCSFGIDIPLEDIFCECVTSSEPGVNFIVRVEVCNNTDDAIDIQMRQPSFAMTFEKAGSATNPFCSFDLKSATTEDKLSLVPGASHTFVVKFGRVSQSCFEKCVTPGTYTCTPPTPCDGLITFDASYLGDGLDRTCMRPLDCAKGLGPFLGLPGGFLGISNCDDLQCPTCGCQLDNVPGGCGCNCQGSEAMNACAAPKELISGATEVSGSGNVCVNVDRNLDASFEGAPIMECRDSNCKLVSFLNAPSDQAGFPSVFWSYSRVADTPGDGSSGSINTTVDTAAQIGDCDSTAVSWDAPDAAETKITVNGVTSSGGSTPGPTIRTGGT